MCPAFMDLPVELEEEALVDGASAFQAFTNIALRLAVPAMVVTLRLFSPCWRSVTSSGV